MKKYILTLAIAGLGLSAFANPPAKKAEEATYSIDAAVSTFKWHATKVTGEHSGVAKFSNGSIQTIGNALKTAEINVDMTTIDATDLTGEYHDKLVNHLKSEDFFSVAKFNTATIKVKSATAIKGNKKDANNYTIVADLTIKGITQEISFPAIVVVNAHQVIVNADINVNRTKFDIRYGSKSFFEGIGDKAISDEFNVKVRVVASK
ncbi:MAG: YceI family protein [bacterium]|nr:YceI family protein [bacterium]